MLSKIIVVLPEPTGSIDLQIKRELLKISEELKKRGIGLVFQSDSLVLSFCTDSCFKNVLICTNMQSVIDLISGKVPCIGLEIENQKERLSGVSYLVQEAAALEPEYLLRVYKRFYKEPWSICKTARLHIREICEADADSLISMCQDDVMPFFPVRYEDIRDVEEFIRTYRESRYCFFEYGIWIIVEKETDRAIGLIGLEERETKTGEKTELGYFVRKELRQQGIAGEAIRAVLGYAAEYFSFEEIYCFVQPENKVSAKTAQSCGFLQTESILDEFDCYIRKLGIDYDS